MKILFVLAMIALGGIALVYNHGREIEKENLREQAMGQASQKREREMRRETLIKSAESLRQQLKEVEAIKRRSDLISIRNNPAAELAAEALHEVRLLRIDYNADAAIAKARAEYP